MRNLLPAALCGCAIVLLSVTTGHAQIKKEPQTRGKIQPFTAAKSSSKLNPALNALHDDFTANRQGKGKAAASAHVLQNLMQVKGDRVLVDFTAKGDVSAAKTELQKMGVSITASYGRMISGYVPVNSLPMLEKATTIRYVKPSYKPLHQPLKGFGLSQGNISLRPQGERKPEMVISQGDTAQRSFLARKKFKVNGKDVKVGVLSDSYDNLGTADIGIKHGELPGKKNPFGFKKPVQVLADLDAGGTDEGRAMMEIIHDVAPGAALAFHSASLGEAAMAQGIQALADKGCDVIVDDAAYLDEPFFQDGILAQSVDQAKKKGVTYFSAAGNQGVGSYESGFHPSNEEPFGPDFGTVHNFSGIGDAPRYFQPLYVPSGGSIILSFQWDQPSFSASGVGPESDFDIFLTDIYGNIVAASYADNIQSGEPFEIFGYFNDTQDYTFFLTVFKYAGPDVSHLKYILYNDAQFYLTNPPIPGILAPALVGHAKADGAIATGAAWYLNTPAYGVDTPYVEYFSSKGGVANYYDVNGKRTCEVIRKKPDIVAPDGANTSFFDPFGNQEIPQDADTYPNFFGTSAAAPHAAGVAALMIEAQKLNSITPDQIKGILSSTAIDMDDIYTDGFDKGFDFNTGYGFINAEKAVGKVKFPNQYIKNLSLKPICSDDPSSVRNWKIINPNPFPMDVEWFVKGSNQHGCLTVQPEDAIFTTNALYSHGCALPNIAVLSWKDNFGYKRFDLAFSTSAKCGRDNISDGNSDRSIAGRKAVTDNTELISADNLVEVFPNPSVNTFSLYLALAGQQEASIELHSIDGRKLFSKTVNQSKGVIDIDAGAYNAGVYLLTVRQGNFSKTIKVIKQ